MKRDTPDVGEIEGQPEKKPKPQDPSRSIYIGNVDPLTSFNELCKIGNQFGPLESAILVPNKKCAFINFLTLEPAQIMHTQYNNPETPAKICDRTVSVGWAKASPLSPEIAAAVEAGATRNLFVTNIRANGQMLPDEVLVNSFRAFGEIENVVVKADKGFAFVNMTSIKAAMAAVQRAESEQQFIIGNSKVIVKYAKERIAPLPAGGFQPRAQVQIGAGGVNVAAVGGMGMGGGNRLQRSVYLGNIPDEATYHDICNIGNQYGSIEMVNISAKNDMRNAFINFIEPEAASLLMSASASSPITLGEATLRVNWAKAAPLNEQIAQALQMGATRNLYLGGLPVGTTEADIRAIFDPFCQGVYDAIKIIDEKKIAFVNLTNIKSAVAAKNQFSNQPCEINGAPIKVNYAKEPVRKAVMAHHAAQQYQQPQVAAAPASYYEAQPGAYGQQQRGGQQQYAQYAQPGAVQQPKIY